MLLAEELGAEPVWVVNSGVSHREDIPTAQIGPWIEVCLQPFPKAAVKSRAVVCLDQSNAAVTKSGL